jgi:hypothetical protein
MPPLSLQQIDDYRRDGFLVLRGLFSIAECAELRAAVDALADAPQTPGGTRWYSDDEAADQGRRLLSRVEYFRDFHEGLRRVMASSRLLEPLAQVFGEPAVLFKDKINYKIPGSSGFLAHQDAQAGWNRYCATQVTVMVSIDATTIENGCLELARGQHTRVVCSVRCGSRSRKAEHGRGDLRTARDRPWRRLLLRRLRAPPVFGPNRTESPRRVLYLTYNPASQGDHYETYFADKRKSYPPDIERPADQSPRYRV